MTLALLLAEAILFIRLLWTGEVRFRLCFTIFLIFAIFSTASYYPAAPREYLLTVALISDVAKALLILEAIWRFSQRRLFFFILAFGIAFGLAIAVLARWLMNKLTPIYGQQVNWHMIALFYMAGAFCFSASYVAISKQTRREKVKAGWFDAILGVYLWIAPILGAWSYLTPRFIREGGVQMLNPEWLAINDVAIMLQIACMATWALTDRSLYYADQELVAEWIRQKRRQYRWVLKHRSIPTHSYQSSPR